MVWTQLRYWYSYNEIRKRAPSLLIIIIITLTVVSCMAEGVGSQTYDIELSILVCSQTTLLHGVIQM